MSEIQLRDHFFVAKPDPKDTGNVFGPSPVSRKRPRSGTTSRSGKRNKAEGYLPTPACTLSERVPVETVRELLERLPEGEERRELVRRETFVREGELKVAYHLKQSGLGRLFPLPYASLGTLKKNLRGALCHETMVDVDMANAHPVILLHEAEKHNWPCGCLKQYVTNREVTLDSIGGTRKQAKVAVLKLINNGGIDPHNQNDPYLCKLKRELANIRDSIWNTHEDIRRLAEARQGTNKYATAVSFFMSNAERLALSAAREKLASLGWEVATLVYDGLMVYKREGRDVADDFPALSEHVREQCGYSLEFEKKPWDLSLTKP